MAENGDKRRGYWSYVTDVAHVPMFHQMVGLGFILIFAAVLAALKSWLFGAPTDTPVGFLVLMIIAVIPSTMVVAWMRYLSDGEDI